MPPSLTNNLAALSKLNARFSTMITVASLAIEPGIKKSADELVEKMKAAAPQRTGALAESIVATHAGEQTPENSIGESQTVPKHHVVITAGNATVDYAVETEFGTSKEAAEPFFYPAIHTMRSDAIKANLKSAVFSALVKGAITKALS